MRATPRRIRIARSNKRSSYLPRSRRTRRFGRKRPRRVRRSSRKSSSRRASGRVLGSVIRSFTAPQTYKSVVAENYAGRQALRSVYGLALGGESILRKLSASRPVSMLWNMATGESVDAAGSRVVDLTSASNYTMVVDKYIWDTRIQNRSNASMELKIYECLVRRDVGGVGIPGFTSTKFSPVDIFHRDLHTKSVLDEDPNQNLIPATYPAGMSHTWQHPGFTPFQSQTFTTSFKIIKTHKLDLHPNQILPMKFYLRSKTFKGRWLTSDASNEWQANWSKLLLFSWVGMPVDDGVTAGKMARAKCDLFVTSDVTIKFHFLPGNPPMARYAYDNEINQDVSNYEFNPAAFTPVIPASDTIQTTVTDTVPPTTPMPAP
ncbi:capsid protein [Antarctic virus 5_I_KPSTAsw004Ad]|nr:capsid protein [Antarctic virus 5_I_KPSTAsw004Ad]